MAKYRKRPVVVEAEQWWPGKDVPGVRPVKGSSRSLEEAFAEFVARGGRDVSSFFDQCGYIETLEGPHLVMPGDWIVTGVKGEKYAVKPDIFEATYEPVEEAGR